MLKFEFESPCIGTVSHKSNVPISVNKITFTKLLASLSDVTVYQLIIIWLLKQDILFLYNNILRNQSQ